MLPRTLLLFFALCGMCFGSASFAAAPTPSNVNRALSGTIQTTLFKRGFAANDPRILNTVARATPYLVETAGSAAAVTLAGITAPAWATVAIAGGVGIALGAAVVVGVGGLSEWYFRSDGRIDVSTAGQAAALPGINVGDPVFQYVDSIEDKVYLATDGLALAKFVYANERARAGFPPTEPSCGSYGPDSNSYWCGNYIVSRHSAGSPISCPPGYLIINSTCSTVAAYSATTPVTQPHLTPQEAIELVPTADYQKQLNPAVLAAAANRAWSQAASVPGYDGLPYKVAQPITAADANAWMQSNPDYAPTVGDFISPNPSSADAPNPWLLPSNATSPNSWQEPAPNQEAVNPATGSLENLGPDPGTPFPALETPPTGYEVAKPIFDLLADFRSFDASIPHGECPTPAVEALGWSLVFDKHCVLIEQNRGLIQTLMALVWFLVAFRVVLSA